MIPDTVRRSSRCNATDTEGIAQRMLAATWTCRVCGLVAPQVQHVAGYTYVHAWPCACQRTTEEAAQAAQETDQVAAQRDRVRMERAIGGMEPGTHAWQMRLSNFDVDLQRDAWQTCVAWTQVVLHTARTVEQQVQAQSQHDGRVDPLAYQVQQRPAWLHSLATVPNLILLGASGVGKSHLALGLYHHLIDAGLKPLYVPGLALLDQIRERWDKDDPDQTEEALLLRLIKAEVVILDGPDMSMRPWSVARWFRLLDGRAATGLPTVVTGASEKRLLAALGEAGYDRVCAKGCVLTLRGTSYRRRQMLTPAQVRARATSLGLPIALDALGEEQAEARTLL